MYSQTENLHVFKLFREGNRMNQQELGIKVGPTNSYLADGWTFPPGIGKITDVEK